MSPEHQANPYQQSMQATNSNETSGSNGGKGLRVVCVLLVVVVLGLTAFIVGLQFVAESEPMANTRNTESTKCISPPAVPVEEKMQEIAPNLTGFTTLTDLGYIYVSKTGEVYLAPGSGPQDYVSKLDFVNGEELGVKGKYKIKGDDFGTHFYPSGDANEYELTAYKLNLSNIVAVGDAQSGNGNLNASVVFIDATGKISIVTVLPGINSQGQPDWSKSKAVVHLNIPEYNNVAGTRIIDEGSGRDTILFKRDGGQEFLDSKYL